MAAALFFLALATLPATPAALAPTPIHKAVLIAQDGSITEGPNATAKAAPPALPVAVVYRGPAACADCAEAVAASLRGRYQVVFAGPKDAKVEKALQGARVYIQPGGGDDMDVGWNAVKPFAGALRDWVRSGGRYVGICMGGFLAGRDPGFELIQSGDSLNYIEMKGADVKNMDDFLITVTWRGKAEAIYFQGGPAFKFDKGAKKQVLATYSNGAIAAVVSPYGRGSVGLTGPHPEAPQTWYDSAGFDDAKQVTRLFVDLVDTTVNYVP